MSTSIVLPPELWYCIVDFMSLESKRTCLFVSKLIHDIALPSIFSHLTIRVGIPPQSSILGSYRFGFYDYLVWRDRTNGELLHHFVHSPQFASMVKTVHVVCYSLHQHQQHSARGCLEALKLALPVLSNLECLTWTGDYTEVQPDVVQIAIQSCPKLTTLRIPYAASVLHLVPDIHGLRKLDLGREALPPSEYEPSGSSALMVLDAVEKNVDTLESLSIFGDGIWQFPPEVFPNLTTLEILQLKDCGKLESILSSSCRLQSLTVRLSTKEHAPSFFAALAAQPASLPHLTSLKLFFYPYDGDSDLAALAGFLVNKKQLRRLHLYSLSSQISGSEWCVTENPLVEVLPQLPNLEVLGLELTVMSLTPAHVAFLDQKLPLSLTTFLYGSIYQRITTSKEDWSGLLRRRPSLTCVHLIDYIQLMDGYTSWGQSDGLADVSLLPERLELFCCMNYLYHLRGELSGYRPRETLSSPTTGCGIGKRSDACWVLPDDLRPDFEDWAWLVRYRLHHLHYGSNINKMWEYRDRRDMVREQTATR